MNNVPPGFGTFNVGESFQNIVLLAEHVILVSTDLIVEASTAPGIAIYVHNICNSHAVLGRIKLVAEGPV